MGYDINLFKDTPNDEFVCAICLGVYKNPVTDECGHVYCCDCLHEWAIVKETCPISCKKLRKGCIRKAPLPLINLVNSLLIKCEKCGDKFVRLDQLEEGCSGCRVSRISGSSSFNPAPSNPRRSSFGQSTRFESNENFWEGEWVKWAGVAGAVGAGLLVLMSNMKKKNRE